MIRETKSLALHGGKIEFEDLLGDVHRWGVFPANRLPRIRSAEWSKHYANVLEIFRVLYEDLYKYDPMAEKIDGEPPILAFVTENYSEDELEEIRRLWNEWRINLEWCAHAVLWDPETKDGFVSDSLLSSVSDKDLLDIVTSSIRYSEKNDLPLKSSASSNAMP